MYLYRRKAVSLLGVSMAFHVHTLPPAYVPHRHVEGDKDKGEGLAEKVDHFA
jgi:hypothetical protein